jgi:hypothetical protein
MCLQSILWILMVFYYAGMYADIIHTKQQYKTTMHQEDSPRLMIIGAFILEQNTFAKY